jgi:inositol-pentakisphosphate 2-kinase
MIYNEATTEKMVVSTHSVPYNTDLKDLSTATITFIDRDEQNHYSPDMPGIPSVCCRTTDSSSEIQHGFYMKYLAEGAANVVFTTHRYAPTATAHKPCVFVSGMRREQLFDPLKFDNKVLRISKGHAKTGSCQEIMDGFEKNIRPLFNSFYMVRGPVPVKVSYAEHLMNYEPVTLTKEVVEELTNEIDEESTRQENLHIPVEEQTGILLPDMGSTPGESVTIEIKPKWLQQSPNAPQDAYRCRTCALEASRPEKDKKPTYICPLQLLAGNATLIRPYVRKKVEKAVKGFGESHPSNAELERIVDRITRYLTTGKGHRLLQHLRRTQIQLDPHGIRARDIQKATNPDFEANIMLAMTMRDTSMYIKVDYSNPEFGQSGSDDDDDIECKLGDLDSKAEGKLDDWEKKEKTLINGGWYTKLDPELERLHHEECLISAGWKAHVPYWW